MPLRMFFAICLFLCSSAEAHESSPDHNDQAMVIEFRSAHRVDHLLLPTSQHDGQIWRDNSHVVFNVTDCANSNWFCLNGGDIAFLAPKVCDGLSLSDWRMGSVMAKRLQQVGELQYFAASDEGAHEALDPALQAGFVYSAQRGVVGIWYRGDATSAPFDSKNLDVLWISPDTTPFMKCRA